MNTTFNFDALLVDFLRGRVGSITHIATTTLLKNQLALHSKLNVVYIIQFENLDGTKMDNFFKIAPFRAKERP